MCSKCLGKNETFTKTHSCLHHSNCVVNEPLDAPHPRSVVWETSCLLMLVLLAMDRSPKRSTLRSLERDCQKSLLEAIFARRRKPGVPKDRQWSFFPSLEVQGMTSPIWSSAEKSVGRPSSRPLLTFEASFLILGSTRPGEVRKEKEDLRLLVIYSQRCQCPPPQR